MAKVTYRGVPYNTNDKKPTKTELVVETYRGVQHTEKVEVCK
jgi:hypothetical protein